MMRFLRRGIGSSCDQIGDLSADSIKVKKFCIGLAIVFHRISHQLVLQCECNTTFNLFQANHCFPLKLEFKVWMPHTSRWKVAA